MHVAVIADFANLSGGAQAVALRSAVALVERGATTRYIHAVDKPLDPRLAAAGVETRGLGLSDVWELSAVQGAGAGIWNPAAARRLRRALDGLPSGRTVLHLHQWTRALSPSVFPVLLGSGHPLVVTLHDYFSACPNGVYYRFDQDEPCTLVPLSLSCLAAPCDPRSMAHKAIRVIRTAAGRASIRKGGFDVIQVSDRALQTLTPFLPAALRQHRIDNPVEIERRPPVEMGEGTAIAYIGRLAREKGPELVAEAGRLAGVPVLFIGDGPSAAEIRRINPEAEITGWLARGEMAELLRTRVRAIAAPSLWYETGPLTIYEGMAAGLPVVASARSGAAEKVEHGMSGFVADPEPAALAEAFRTLQDTGLARRMGREGYRRYWAAPLSPDAHADALLALYREILSRPGQLSAA